MNRRQFERLQLPQDAYAVDERGRQVGRISTVGGGGLRLDHLAPGLAPELQPGRRLRLTVVEPQTRNTHTLEVVVRYRAEDHAGVEFVAEKKPRKG